MSDARCQQEQKTAQVTMPFVIVTKEVFYAKELEGKIP